MYEGEKERRRAACLKIERQKSAIEEKGWEKWPTIDVTDTPVRNWKEPEEQENEKNGTAEPAGNKKPFKRKD